MGNDMLGGFNQIMMWEEPSDQLQVLLLALTVCSHNLWSLTQLPHGT